MRIGELAKELGITPKELIAYLKDNGFVYSSHMQKIADDAYDFVQDNYVKPDVEDDDDAEKVSEAPASNKTSTPAPIEVKKYEPDDLIPCKSVVPFKLNALSVDKTRVYHWEYFGDVDYLTYRDLSALRRSKYITKPWIIIEDADLCYQWRRELGDTYKYFLGVEYPEEFFEKDDDEFTTLLKKAPDTLKDVIKTTAIGMIHAQNFPTVQKIRIVDETLGTCLMEFLS